ncbi:unnamed protein product [Strongylus vulgaris]|uniref:Uncharacterized protein n=1 Tax=Strongylus vulgaris TaxID=40348 RepID=A0A3P7KHG8_STRVU|nr:unnamed protein product [Strongylus vulgaris]
MSYLKPAELYENGSSYSDIDRSSNVKEIAEKSTSRPEISRMTPSPGYTSSTAEEQHPEEDERSRLINIQNAITNGSIKEQQYENI